MGDTETSLLLNAYARRKKWEYRAMAVAVVKALNEAMSKPNKPTAKGGLFRHFGYSFKKN